MNHSSCPTSSDDFKTESHHYSLCLEKVSHCYRYNDLICQNFTGQFDSGKLYAIMGPSGCGKSTLLHIASGYLTPSMSGKVFFDKQDFTGKNIPGSSYIFSDHYLIAELSCLENLQIIGATHDAIEKVSKQLFIYELLQRYPESLSSGQLQRVSCARALLQAKTVLFADEPTSHLDRKHTQDFMNSIRTIVRQQNLIFICVTHDKDIASYFDKVIEL